MLTKLTSKLLNVSAFAKGHKLVSCDSLDTSAPSIIFVHGLGSSQNYYFALLEQLTQKFNCILFDSEGAAQSPLSSIPPTLDSMADDVIHVLDHFKIETASIVGHSMGGMISIKVAEKYRQRVSHLALIGPVHPSESLSIIFTARIKQITEKGSVQELADSVPNTATGSKALPIHKAFIRDLIMQQSVEGYAASCKVIATSTPPDYNSIDAPTLIILGQDDKTAPYKGNVEFIDKNFRVKPSIVTLEGVGHWHCIENSDAVGGELIKFFH